MTELTDAEKRVARQAGMTYEEYAAFKQQSVDLTTEQQDANDERTYQLYRYAVTQGRFSDEERAELITALRGNNAKFDEKTEQFAERKD